MVKGNAISLYRTSGTVLHDAVKTLRTNILFSSVDEPIKTIVITSVIPHEGKSTVSIFLAIAMAESGMRTLLVECDCRRPMLQNYLKVRPESGLIDVLRKQVTFEAAVCATELPKLDLISCPVLANPVEILGSERFRTVIEQQRKNYDIIILDTPPLGSFIEAAILASKADGTVLVMRPGSTDIEAAQGVVSQLEKAKARVLGVVLNGVDMSSSDYYYSDYYYRGERKKRKKSSKSGKAAGEESAEPGKKPGVADHGKSSKLSAKRRKSSNQESERHALETAGIDDLGSEEDAGRHGRGGKGSAGEGPDERVRRMRSAMEASMKAARHD